MEFTVDKRQAAKKEIRYALAKARSDAMPDDDEGRGEPGNASAHFEGFHDLDMKDVNVVVVGRVSTQKQADKGHLEDQVKSMKAEAKQAGANVVAIVRHVGRADNPEWAKRIAIAAKKFGATHALFENVTRAVRHPMGHKNKVNYDWVPREEDYAKFDKVMGNIIKVTMVQPDAAMEQIRGSQIKRGQLARNKKDRKSIPKGPGYKKRIRERYEQQVIELHAQGLGSRRIAKIISETSGHDVSYGTVHKWATASGL